MATKMAEDLKMPLFWHSLIIICNHYCPSYTRHNFKENIRCCCLLEVNTTIHSNIVPWEPDCPICHQVADRTVWFQGSHITRTYNFIFLFFFISPECVESKAASSKHLHTHIVTNTQRLKNLSNFLCQHTCKLSYGRECAEWTGPWWPCP